MGLFNAHIAHGLHANQLKNLLKEWRKEDGGLPQSNATLSIYFGRKTGEHSTASMHLLYHKLHTGVGVYHVKNTPFAGSRTRNMGRGAEILC